MTASNLVTPTNAKNPKKPCILSYVWASRVWHGIRYQLCHDGLLQPFGWPANRALFCTMRACRLAPMDTMYLFALGYGYDSVRMALDGLACITVKVGRVWYAVAHVLATRRTLGLAFGIAPPKLATHGGPSSVHTSPIVNDMSAYGGRMPAVTLTGAMHRGTPYFKAHPAIQHPLQALNLPYTAFSHHYWRVAPYR